MGTYPVFLSPSLSSLFFFEDWQLGHCNYCHYCSAEALAAALVEHKL
jgi:hypothetical protein